MLEAYLEDRLLRELEARLESEPDAARQGAIEFLAKEPANPHALWILARCQLLAEEFGEARSSLETLLEQDPDNVRAKMDLAKILANDGDTRGAIALLREVTTIRPNIADAWAVLGAHLREDGQEEASQDTLKQYAMIKTFNDHLQAARQAFANADFKTADSVCRHLLRLVPNEIRVLRLLARIASRFQYYEFSTSTLLTCVEARPADAELRLDYAQALLRGRQYQDALKECDRAIELAPEILGAYDLKAELLFHLGRYDEAASIYRALSEVPEKRALSLLHLGKVLKTIGETAAQSTFQGKKILQAVIKTQATSIFRALYLNSANEIRKSLIDSLLNTNDLQLIDDFFTRMKDFTTVEANEDMERIEIYRRQLENKSRSKR